MNKTIGCTLSYHTSKTKNTAPRMMNMSGGNGNSAALKTDQTRNRCGFRRRRRACAPPSVCPHCHDLIPEKQSLGYYRPQVTRGSPESFMRKFFPCRIKRQRLEGRQAARPDQRTIHARIPRHRHRDRDRRQAGQRPQEGRTARAGAAGLQEHRASGASARGVKLGPIGARRVSGGPFVRRQNSGNAFIFRPFGRFQQAEKTARHQVVWS
jgi:hypothetical protein